MTPSAQRQAAYRARYNKRSAVLRDIVDLLQGNDKPMATKVRKMAEDALK